MSVVLAVGYVTSLATVYYLFVKWYYSRAATRSQTQKDPSSWFASPHTTKEAYLKYYDSIENDTFTPDQVKQLKTLLMRRAMTNVERVLSLREDRTTLAILMTNGSIGDQVWHEFLEAEQEIDQEITSCVQEAEALQPGWGRMVFPQAAQLLNREKEKEIMEQSKKLNQSKTNEEQIYPSLQTQKLQREQLEKELIEEEERQKKGKKLKK